MKITSSIKWSIAATVAIVAAGIWMLRQNQTQLDELRQKPAVDNVVSEPLASAPPHDKKTDKDTTPEPKAAKVEISMVTAVAAESIASRAQGRMKTSEENQHQKDLNDRINALDAGQLEEFVNDVAAYTELPTAEKQWWIAIGIQVLGRSDLDKAIELLGSKNLEIMKGSNMEAATVSMLLNPIAQKDPEKAFRKLDTCASKLPGLNLERINSGLLVTVARSDIDKAFQLMESRLEPFGASAVQSCLGDISMRSCTEDQSLSLISYMNGYFTRMKDAAMQKKIQNDILLSLGSTFSNKGCESTVRWMERAKLNREQYVMMGNCAACNSHGPEIGKWLEWVSRETPYQSAPKDDQSDWCHRVRNVAMQWLSHDTVAFGSWLETQKPGEVKNMCIVEFAHSIAEDHPETAAEWVKQITYEDDRKFMFNEIYRKANFKSDEERGAFAKKYGVE